MTLGGDRSQELNVHGYHWYKASADMDVRLDAQVTEAYMLSCSYDVRMHMPLSAEHLWYKFYTTYDQV